MKVSKIFVEDVCVCVMGGICVFCLGVFGFITQLLFILCGQMCHCAPVELGGQTAGVCFLLLLCGTQKPHSGPWSWQWAPSPREQAGLLCIMLPKGFLFVCFWGQCPLLLKLGLELTLQLRMTLNSRSTCLHLPHSKVTNVWRLAFSSLSF